MVVIPVTTKLFLTNFLKFPKFFMFFISIASSSKSFA